MIFLSVHRRGAQVAEEVGDLRRAVVAELHGARAAMAADVRAQLEAALDESAGGGRGGGKKKKGGGGCFAGCFG